MMKKTLTTIVCLLMTICSFGEIASGTCGEYLTWSLSDDYTLVIEGEGDMINMANESQVDWYSYKNKIAKVLIGNKVTSIGRNAFFNCYKLTSITIPNSVTSIEAFAFEGCI